MDGIHAGIGSVPTFFAAASPLAASALQLRAAAPDDLGGHLQALAEAGRLPEFLDSTALALDLAAADPTFAAELDDLLGRIRDALGELDLSRLPRVDRDQAEDVVARIEDHLGPTAQVPGGGLQAHEDAGGHLIERHVGWTEAQLVDRVRRENISAASSFADLPSAEALVAATQQENAGRIDAWLDGQGGNRLVVNAQFDAVTGISVARGENQATEVHSVRLVLERSGALDVGYRIVTGYPNAP
ncbi:RNase A-like domain-containing protein [Coralloluteibacterium thermophilus]|uniref:RNase A-like domain-containing protein n=1 Tax=Coralloluteibacterium thermophilum TaxID=2707049 RepID=A0ABV9NK07_9GAMM